MRTDRLLACVAGVALATAALTGCSSSDRASTSSTTTSSAAPSSAPGTTAGATTGTTAPPAGPASTPAPPAPPAPVVPGRIEIVDYGFEPEESTIRPGEAVTWRNGDPVDHWVVATDPTGAFDSQTMAPGSTFSATLTTPGTYAYYCNIHNGMTGSITVS